MERTTQHVCLHGIARSTCRVGRGYMWPYLWGMWGCVFCWLGPFLQAQAPQFDFLTVTDGLATDVATAVFRDRQHFVWIGTQSGLQRYDGYQLQTYPQAPDNPRGLRSGAIKDILEDSQGDLWIGTAKAGLARYCRKTDDFDTFAPDSQRQGFFPYWGLTSLHQGREGDLWAFSPLGLVRFQAAAHPEFRTYPQDDADSTKLFSGPLKSWAQDSSGNIWVTTRSRGLCVLPAGELTKPVSEARWQRIRPTASPILAQFILSMAVLPNHEIWLGLRRGAARLSPEENLSMELPAAFQDVGMHTAEFPDVSSPFSGQQNVDQIYQLSVGPAGTLWLVSSMGLGRWYPASDSVGWYTLDDMGIPSRGFNMPSEIYIDPQGLMWVSTFEGLARPADRDPHFVPWLLPDTVQTTLVRAVWMDSHGQMWMGIENGGIWLLDKQRIPYEQIHLNHPRPGLNEDFIMALREDSAGHMWAATYGAGCFRLDLKRDSHGRVIDWQGHLARPLAQFQSTGDYYGYSLLEDRQGRMWEGSFDRIYVHYPDHGQTRSYDCKVANDLIETRKGNLLVGTDEGLLMLDEEQDRLVPISVSGDSSALSRYRVECLNEAPDGSLWIGTRQGLLWVAADRDSMRMFDQDDGLTHPQIRSMIRDQHGVLWVITLNGIHQWRDGQFLPYGRTQGVFHEEFVNRAAHMDAGGHIYVGGDLGVVAFHPDSLQAPTPIPAVQLTDLYLFGQRVRPQEPTAEGYLLETPVTTLSELVLGPKERMVSFEFAGLGYRQATDYVYTYQLTGFDETWQVQEASQRLATYTNLPPGQYVFRVTAHDRFGQAAGKSVALPVKVYPPWWRRWWAYGLYGLVLVLVVVWLLQQRTRSLRREMAVQMRIEAAKAEERELVRARSARDFHDEAGTYLTKLSLYTGLLRQQPQSAEVGQTIMRLEENIKGLAGGMRDFIWVLDSRRDSLRETMLRLRGMAEDLFAPTNIAFRYREEVADAETLHLSMQVRRHLLLIGKEALNNALKYAEAQEVILHIQQAEETLRVSIIDNGIGFSPEDLTRVNGLQNMQSRAEEMGGSLTVDASPGLGTALHLQWPIHPNG